MMAKRRNPFVDDFIPQSKIHVGDKQILAHHEEQLKKVYEKTLSLLFRGAKKLPPESTLNNNNEFISHNKKDNMKQLFIGKNGTLEHSGVLSTGSRGTLTSCCGAWCAGAGAGAGAGVRCAYCERALCSVCARRCAGCERAHCAGCSLTGSDGGEMCVSCYP